MQVQNTGHRNSNEASAGVHEMTTEQPPQSRDIGRAIRIAHAREQLVKVVNKLRRAGVTDEEIKTAFGIATMKDE
jgi:hypothetical protein